MSILNIHTLTPRWRYHRHHLRHQKIMAMAMASNGKSPYYIHEPVKHNSLEANIQLIIDAIGTQGISMPTVVIVIIVAISIG